MKFGMGKGPGPKPGAGCKVGGYRRGYTDIRWSGRMRKLGIVNVDGVKEGAEKGRARQSTVSEGRSM